MGSHLLRLGESEVLAQLARQMLSPTWYCSPHVCRCLGAPHHMPVMPTLSASPESGGGGRGGAWFSRPPWVLCLCGCFFFWFRRPFMLLRGGGTLHVRGATDGGGGRGTSWPLGVRPPHSQTSRGETGPPIIGVDPKCEAHSARSRDSRHETAARYVARTTVHRPHGARARQR